LPQPPVATSLLRKHFQRCPAEVGQVVGPAAADMMIIHDDRCILPVRTGVDQIILNARRKSKEL
jgi:hypothetical protein